MSSTITNDQLIQAVFSATPEAKQRALEILQGKEPPVLNQGEGSTDSVLLRMGEAAKFLNVSRATLWRMIRAGRLEKVELYTNSYRLRRADVLAVVNGKSAGGASC